MKKKNIILMLFLTIGFLFGTVSTPVAAVPSCSEMGYTKTSTACTGLPVIKCPTDTSQIFCATTCDAVSVGKYEKCTKYCAENTNICIEKRDMTCSEYITANNGEKIADGANIIGNKTKNLYLMGTAKAVTGSNASLNKATFIQMSIYAAEDIPACKAEGAKTAYLDFKNTSNYITGWANFYVKADLGYLYYQAGGNPTWNSANFYRDTTIQSVNMYSNSTWVSSLTLNFINESGGTAPNSTVNLSCDGNGSSSWYPDICNVQINAISANVKYCENVVGTNVKFSLECYNGTYDDVIGSCTKASYCY